jgi:hypothetical protein
MKTKARGPWGLGVVGIVLGCGAITAAHAEGFAKPEPSVVAKLRNAYQKRTAGSCAPTAPMQTAISFGSQPRIGEPVTLHFDVTAMERGVGAEIRFEITEGVQFLGRGRETGDLEKGRGYRFSRQVVFNRPGTYEIAAQAIAGIPQARFGRRDQVFVQVSEDRVRYSINVPFGPTADDNPNGQAERSATNTMKPLFYQNVLPTPGAEAPKTDPDGKMLDGGEGGGGVAAATTVTGHWRYQHTDGTFHWGYGAQAQAWDDDVASGDDLLDIDIVDSVGYFELNFDNLSDGGAEPGTADVYIRWITDNSEVQVHNAADVVYANATGVIFPDITGGSHEAGTWHPLSNQRAFQLEDKLTRGWSFAQGFGHDPHKTFCEWYTGSVDGAYYRRSEDRIYIHDATVPSIDVILHEYGHSFHDSFNGDADWPPGAGGPHWFTNHYTDGLALTEGYGTYFCCAAQGDDRWYDDLDPGNLIHFDCEANWDGHGDPNGNSDGLSVGVNFHGYNTESAVLAMLLDIDDTNNSPGDPYDWSSFGGDEIHDIFFNHMVSGHHLYSIRDFYDGWYDRNHAYRPKMNGQMMVHGMEQPIDRLTLGLYDGLNLYAGQWYYGGYGRASFFAKNYGSQPYQLNRLYVWVVDPDGTDIPGFGGDGNNDPIPSGGTREIWKAYDQVGLNSLGNPVANPAYGDYRIRAGHYRSDDAWQLLDPTEAGTDRDVLRNVAEDTTEPTLTSSDDGAYQLSTNSIHLTATATEAQSSIKSFWVQLGSAPGGNDILAWTEFLQNNDPTFDEVVNFPAVSIGTTIYATVVARNIENLDGFSQTNGIQVVSPEIQPTSFVRVRGTIIAGNNVSFVQTSNDSRMQVQPGVVLVSSQMPIELTFTGNIPLMELNSINLKVESNATAASIHVYIDMWDYDAGEWFQVRDAASTAGDTLYQHVRADWDRFVSAGGEVKARIRYKAVGPVLLYPYTTRLDWIHWTLN